MAWALQARRRRLLLAAFVFGHLLVISGQVDGGQGSSLLQRAILAVVSPFQRLVGAGVHVVSEAWRAYLDLRHVREDNRRLAQRADVLEQLLQQKQDQAREAERLRELMRLRETLPLDTVAAEVVARQGMPWFRSMIVNQGLEAGVSLNAPALVPAGVVGRVVAVGPGAARLQLLLDRDSSVGVLIERSRVTGIAQGRVGLADAGTSDLVMKYVAALADVVAGDVVVTSGLDGIYPKGLLVGRVRSVGLGAGLFRDVVVSPAAAFDQIEEVLLLKAPPRDLSLTESVR